MPDERTYGFSVDDAAALLQSIGTGVSTYQETRPRGGSSSSSSSSASSCPCTCIDEGDIEVDGVSTTSRWSLSMSAEVFKGTYGDITFPAGSYVVFWDVTEEKWVLDIGDVLTAAYHSGNDATADTTMDGTLEMTLVGPYGVPTISLCLDGEVPEEV